MRHCLTLVVLDVAVVAFALGLALLSRFGGIDARQGQVLYLEIAAVYGVLWCLALAASGAYETRYFGSGPEEYKRVIAASIRTIVLVAFGLYVVKLDAARVFIGGAFVLGLMLLLVERYLARLWLVRQRFQGRLTHRLLAVGAPSSIDELVQELAAHPHAGLTIVGACTPGVDDDKTSSGIQRIGTLDNVAAVAQAMGVDAVVATSAAAINPRVIREIAWSLEGLGVDLIIAPSLSGVAGPRITMRPIGGLALLHVEQPAFTGARRAMKTGIDWVSAALGLLLLSPLLLAIGAVVRLTDKGPALYRQTRVGLAGHEFRVFKFRTMYTDAEHRLAELLDRNEGDGLLFKIKDDPRVTPVGRWLRRLSLDELPQLLNILFGHMSLVGPRPLAVTDSAFEGHVRRRLLVKPGITGLWQVMGRQDQSWDEAVRLDLHYVENWSIALDLAILARTVRVVARRDGAW
ncbi:MAG: sugar transferase [Geodermatophilaceae bacterium]|nr:sugar transferase [Geodermatophilaceae bacterium]